VQIALQALHVCSEWSRSYLLWPSRVDVEKWILQFKLDQGDEDRIVSYSRPTPTRRYGGSRALPTRFTISLLTQYVRANIDSIAYSIETFGAPGKLRRQQPSQQG
jgi:hypothetical protein